MQDTAASPPYCSWYGIGCNSTAYSRTCTTSGAAAQGIRSVELTNNDVNGRVDDPAFLQAVKQLHDCGLKELVVGGSSFGVRGCVRERYRKRQQLHISSMHALLWSMLADSALQSQGGATVVRWEMESNMQGDAF
jgi:hypothetical protein